VINPLAKSSRIKVGLCPIILQPNVGVDVGGNLTCGKADIVVLVPPNKIGIQVSEIVLHNFLVLTSWSSMLLMVVVFWVVVGGRKWAWFTGVAR
jgi:hypothetical protein